MSFLPKATILFYGIQHFLFYKIASCRNESSEECGWCNQIGMCEKQSYKREIEAGSSGSTGEDKKRDVERKDDREWR